MSAKRRPAQAARKWRRNALELLKMDSELLRAGGSPSPGAQAAFGKRASMAISARSLRTASRSRELSHARASSRV